MARQLFGTDGVRGLANTHLDCNKAFLLGQAAVKFLGKQIVVGKDTRISGDMLEAALCAGITSAGGCAMQAGVVPTPAVAFMAKKPACAGGVVISASHNPPQYNGIKFFDECGFKLPDSLENEIEAFVLAGGMPANELPAGDAVGSIVQVEGATELYVQHAIDTISGEGINFDGMHIALDAAHGAAYKTTQQALESLGAKVSVINNTYTGCDINVKCGSTNLGQLKNLVASEGCCVGIAHDGDADRVMLVDAQGNEIDGDVIEAVCALDLRARGKLKNNTVVTTVMANLGFVRAMENAGINVEQTKVGDRYVLEAMRGGGFVLGGEQSGHMIFLEHNSTGDGLITALQFLAACKRSGKTPGEAAQVVTKFPQVLINVQVSNKQAAIENSKVHAAVSEAQAALGKTGRVLLRPSGTEPVVRVMVEAESEEVAQKHANKIASVVGDV